MPDYSIVKSLCEELEITVAELLDGEISEEKSVRTYDEEQIVDLLRRTQELEKHVVRNYVNRNGYCISGFFTCHWWF